MISISQLHLRLRKCHSLVASLFMLEEALELVTRTAMVVMKSQIRVYYAKIWRL